MGSARPNIRPGPFGKTHSTHAVITIGSVATLASTSALRRHRRLHQGPKHGPPARKSPAPTPTSECDTRKKPPLPPRATLCCYSPFQPESSRLPQISQGSCSQSEGMKNRHRCETQQPTLAPKAACLPINYRPRSAFLPSSLPPSGPVCIICWLPIFNNFVLRFLVGEREPNREFSHFEWTRNREAGQSEIASLVAQIVGRPSAGDERAHCAHFRHRVLQPHPHPLTPLLT